MVSDRTYTIEAWAVNEDREVLSPKATLKVHSVEQPPARLRGGPSATALRFRDYVNEEVEFGTLLTTEFTVLK